MQNKIADISALSEIKISESHTATLQFLTNRLKHRKQEFPAPSFFMLLGAGCSLDAQIPSGNGIISFLQKLCFAQWNLSYTDESDLNIDNIDKLFATVEARNKLENFVLEKQRLCHSIIDEQKSTLINTIPLELRNILSKQNEKKDLWEIVKKEFYHASYYSFWFDITLPSPRDRQQLIEKIIDKKEPSAAYFLLACAVKKDVFRTFFTTNFDDLINDAILQEIGVKSRVYVHNEVVKFINFKSPRPNIIKLHGDYLYQDMKNTLPETSALQDDQFYKLQEASQDMGAIIVGYSGADLSIMNALYKIKEQKGAEFPLFWCSKDETSLTWRAKYLINKFENSYFVPTESFDQLAHSIYLDLNCKIRDIKEKTEAVEKNHKNATDLIARLNKVVNIPEYLEDKKEKLEDDLSINEIIANAKSKKEIKDKIEYLSLGIAKYPNNVSLYLWRGFYLHDSSNFKDATFDNDKVIKLDPVNATAYNNRGNSKDQLKMHEEAIADYNKAIELETDNVIYYLNRSIALRKLKMYDNAIKDCTKAIELDSNNANGFYYRGLLYNDLQMHEEAILDYNQSVKLDSTNSDVYTSRGDSKADIKLFTEATIDYNKAIEIDPKNPAPYINKANIKTNLKMHKEAIAAFDEIIASFPEVSTAYNNRGHIKNILKKYDEAIIDLNQAIQLDPNDPLPYRHKATALIYNGDLVAAENCVQKALDLDKEYANAYATLAAIYAVKKETKLFYKYFETALKKNMDLNSYNIFEDDIYKPFLVKIKFQNLLKKYNK